MFRPSRLHAVAVAVAAVVAAPAAPVAGQDRGVEKVSASEVSVPLALTVRVNGKAGRLLRALDPGDTLHSGDLVELVVSVDRPAFVYIVQRFPDGSAAVLHPESGDLQLPAALETRLPEPGAWYQLDQTVGEEHLYVVASERPLSDADREVAEALARVRTEGTLEAPAVAPAAPPRPAPVATPKSEATSSRPVAGGSGSGPSRPAPAPEAGAPPAAGRLTFATRGLVKAVVEGVAEVEADSAGIAIYQFWFRHEPARSSQEVSPP